MLGSAPFGLPSLRRLGLVFTTAILSCGLVLTGSLGFATPAAAAGGNSASSTSSYSDVVNYARTHIGKPYQWGGDGPSRFDCSGLTSYVYDQAGIDIPRTANSQRQSMEYIPSYRARQGDLVFFHSSSGRVYHTGVLSGIWTIIDSPRPGRYVSERKMWTKQNVSFGRP